MVRFYLLIALVCVHTTAYSVRYAVRKKRSALTTYSERRDTKKSGEPAAYVQAKKSKSIFVVQKHNASHLHYDFRLEVGGVLVSWAVPKGPPQRAGIKRLAMQTDDHPLTYATFEGTIPEGNYGAGTVEIWDHGTYANASEETMQQQLKAGQIEFELHGTQLKGIYVLIRTQKDDRKWLLIKKKKKS